MKTLLNSLAIALAGALSLGVMPARAAVEVAASVQIGATADFYAPLEPHGVWIEVGSYGRCWRPAHLAVEWRPYCDGHWVWTDCGWYWASDEPWGWACYHYGNWAYDSSHGWVWVPGIEWAPAWVTWRVGGGYVGWAPLPPRGVVIAAPRFAFVEVDRFHERVRPATVIVNNTTVINKTTVIDNNIKRESRTLVAGAAPQKVVVNAGPGVDLVRKATGQTVTPMPIHEAVKQTPVPPSVALKAGPKHKLTPGEAHNAPSRPSASEKTPPPDKEGVAPSPTPPSQGPPRPALPPEKEQRSDKERVVPTTPHQGSPTGPPRQHGKPPSKKGEGKGGDRRHDRDRN